MIENSSRMFIVRLIYSVPTSGWLLRTFLTVLGSCSSSSSSRSEAGTREEGTASTPVPGRALHSSYSQLVSVSVLVLEKVPSEGS